MSAVDPMFPRRRALSAGGQGKQKPILPEVVPKAALSPIEATKPGLKLTSRRRVKSHKQSRSRLPKRYIIAVLLIVALCFVPEGIGQILVIAYGLLTILRRYSMQLTFIVAVSLLLLAPFFTWLTGAEGNGAILASYSFMLLGLGLVQLILAYRRVASPRSQDSV